MIYGPLEIETEYNDESYGLCEVEFYLNDLKEEEDAYF